ncbi:hypothetical protein JSE7799_02448 [Jannaschia seosinensis]|uniref:Uncharacterized protein n=1 Tax=Jannaschia seosinensis TaxID=313367 RepID=A0A0M7BAF7_9RHOB|nr:hypothetical protein [Jannaschia seosinensis]CUH39720.1 hypothetical protein JSE7799_02448 [Jannaschia seosinensis]
MTPRTAQTVADVIAIAVAVFFIVSPSFEGMPGRQVMNAVAIFVIGLSLWRLWRRHRSGT